MNLDPPLATVQVEDYAKYREKAGEMMNALFDNPQASDADLNRLFVQATNVEFFWRAAIQELFSRAQNKIESIKRSANELSANELPTTEEP